MLTAANRVSAVFDSEAQAERAIVALRQLGVRDSQLSVVARHGETVPVGTGNAPVTEHGDTAGERMGTGALVGAGGRSRPAVTVRARHRRDEPLRHGRSPRGAASLR